MVKATKDNRPFSSGVFDLEEFNIYTKVIDLPLDGIPTYLEEGINGVCTGGSALFRWVLSIPFFISCIRQQNPLTVLSKIILRKVKQFNLPPQKK